MRRQGELLLRRIGVEAIIKNLKENAAKTRILKISEASQMSKKEKKCYHCNREATTKENV